MRLGLPGALCFFVLAKATRSVFGQALEESATSYYEDYQLYEAGEQRGMPLFLPPSLLQQSRDTVGVTSIALLQSCFMGPGVPLSIERASGVMPRNLRADGHICSTGNSSSSYGANRTE